MIQVKYVNSLNQSISFFSESMKVSQGSFHQRKWTISEDDITKDAITYNLTLTLRGKIDERKQMLNNLYDVFEIDLINKSPGKLYFGDYYIRCYITSANTKPNSILNCRTDNVIEVHCPKQSWIKENKFSFFPNQINNNKIFENKKYDYIYDYKYGENPGSDSIINDAITESYFKLIIYGPASNPSIMIGKNIYAVNIDLNVGDYLIIESLDRQIYITDVNGVQKNVFDNRSKDNYIFQKISPGLNNIEWSAGFGFDVIIYDERSEPKWT